MPLYTDMVADNIEDYARGGRDGELKLQNMPEDASLEAWAAKLQEIADEFVCAPRYFLMCWLAAECLGRDLFAEDTYTGEFPAFRCPVKKGKKEVFFQPVSKKWAEDLSDEERNQYIDVLAEMAAEREGEKPGAWRQAFRNAFLWYDKKERLLPKETGFKIAHALHMSYEETKYFLSRALENDGFDFTRSKDIIHAYCCLRGKRYGDFVRLKEQYDAAAKGAEKREAWDKPERFTEAMMPTDDGWQMADGWEIGEEWPTGDERQIGGGEKAPGSLSERIAAWEKENIEPAASGMDAVDVLFLDWMKAQAAYLDVPGKSAMTMYRRLTAYVYEKSVEEHSGDAEESVPEEAFFEDEYSEEEYGEAGLRKICGEESPYLLPETGYEEIVKAIQRKLNELTAQMYGTHTDRLTRYLYVDKNGRLTNMVVTGRIPLLLAGREEVTKADMLFMLWLVCVLYWQEHPEDARSRRVWDFCDMADEVLLSSHLPEFYIPHVLERTFLVSLCLDGLESESEEIFYGGLTPMQIYSAICQYVIRRE